MFKRWIHNWDWEIIVAIFLLFLMAIGLILIGISVFSYKVERNTKVVVEMTEAEIEAEIQEMVDEEISKGEEAEDRHKGNTAVKK